MDYKEKYEQGLECIQEILSGAGNTIKTSILQKRLQPFFSELKESEDERIRKGLIENFKWFCGDFPETSKWGKDDDLLVTDILAWLEKQGEILDKDKFAKEFLRSVAISIMNWLDANTPEGKMCLSNMECEDIENAVRNADWSKVYAYMKKKLEKQNKQEQTWKPNTAQLIVIKDLIEDKNTSNLNKAILRGMLNELNSQSSQFSSKHLLDPDKVIEWLKTHGNLVPIVTIKINEVIAKFKKDFGL